MLRVHAEDFLRPRSVRLEHGPHDADAGYERWVDHLALRREVLDPLGPDGDLRWLPTLWDPATDRATRAPREQAAPGSTLVVDGPFLLRWETADAVDVGVHLQAGDAALARRLAPRRPGAGARRLGPLHLGDLAGRPRRPGGAGGAPRPARARGRGRTSSARCPRTGSGPPYQCSTSRRAIEMPDGSCTSPDAAASRSSSRENQRASVTSTPSTSMCGSSGRRAAADHQRRRERPRLAAQVGDLADRRRRPPPPPRGARRPRSTRPARRSRRGSRSVRAATARRGRAGSGPARRAPPRSSRRRCAGSARSRRRCRCGSSRRSWARWPPRSAGSGGG